MTPIEKARSDTLFQRFLARSFGQREITTINEYTVVGFHWRGYMHVTHSYRHTA